MFKEAKVGDRVWDHTKGWGTITEIDGNNDRYPINVIIDNGDLEIYNDTGFYYSSDKYQSLFWDEVKITLPAKPKRMVKKLLTRWAVIFKDGSATHGYHSVTQARNNVNIQDRDLIFDCIKLTGEYETLED